jgi:hypothetical protein
MTLTKSLGKICTPALVYFWISVIAVFLSLFQNTGGKGTKYTLGTFSCKVPSIILIYTLKILYILFWTWILNLICKDGYVWVSWLLVLLPFIVAALVVGIIMINQ